MEARSWLPDPRSQVHFTPKLGASALGRTPSAFTSPSCCHLEGQRSDLRMLLHPPILPAPQGVFTIGEITNIPTARVSPSIPSDTGGRGEPHPRNKVGPPPGVPLDPAGIQQRGEGNRTNRVGETQWISVPLAPPPFSVAGGAGESHPHGVIKCVGCPQVNPITEPGWPALASGVPSFIYGNRASLTHKEQVSHRSGRFSRS